MQKAATEAGLLQRKLLDEGDSLAVENFKKAGVTVDSMPAAELARMQDKVKPVLAKFSPQIGDEFVKGFFAEIEQARKAQ